MAQITQSHISILELYEEAHINKNEASINLFVQDCLTKFNIVKNFLKESEEPQNLNVIAFGILRLYCKSEEYYLSEKNEYHLSEEAKVKFLNFAKEKYERLKQISNEEYKFYEVLEATKTSFRR